MIRSIHDVAAPAKLNLFLHVVGRRDDGYHLLQSLMVLVDWSDTLHFELRTDGVLARHDLGPALPSEDLCLKAARLLQAESGTAFGADISVAKHLPWGAGMGGGSSDAASTLLALNRLWGLNWSRSRLLKLGLRLGADVPFFVGGRNALAQGIGEVLTPVELPTRWYAIVKPPVAIETRAVFGSPLLVPKKRPDILTGCTRTDGLTDLDGSGPGGLQTVAIGTAAAGTAATASTKAASMNAVSVNAVSAKGSVGDAVLAAGFGCNDLEEAAKAVSGQVGEAVELLRHVYGNSRMTGSGSAVFAIAGEGAQASSLLPQVPQGWSAKLCRGLARHPLAEWAVDRDWAVDRE